MLVIDCSSKDVYVVYMNINTVIKEIISYVSVLDREVMNLAVEGSVRHLNWG